MNKQGLVLLAMLGALAFAACSTHRALPGEAPLAVDDQASTLMNQAVTIDPLANDSDPDGDELTLDRVDLPARGSVALDGNLVVYTPETGFVGQESFDYAVVDQSGLLATATITVTVEDAANAPPLAADDQASTAFETEVLIPVLANDSDPDGDTLAISALTSPGHGLAFIAGGTAVRYAPALGFAGTDSFDYTLIDGRGGSDTATVTVTVGSAGNRPPVAADDAVSTYVDYPLRIAVLANDSDPDGDGLAVVSVTTPAHGTATVNPDDTITYVPQAAYEGADAFAYTVADGAGGSDEGAVTVAVSGAPQGCGALGQICDAGQPDQGAFACVGLGIGPSGICLDKCALATQPDPCAAGSICYDPFGGDQPFGACLPSDCTNLFNSATDCADQGAHGGTCLPVGNAASFCVPAGLVTAGGACGPSHYGPADEVCASGLLCIDGLCEAPCNTAEDFCQGGGDCLAVFDGHPELGLCRTTCTPYQLDECAAGFTCFPFAADEGICLAAGQQAEGEACGAQAGECAEGLLCVGEDADSVCLRFCDPQALAGEPGSCLAAETCLDPNLGYLGICITTCDPWAQNPGCSPGTGCAPDPLAGGLCVPVGQAGAGEVCAPPYQWEACAEGLLCRPDAPDDAQGLCETLCQPFAGNGGDCPGGLCGLLTSWLGTCTDQSLNLDELDDCPVQDAGAFCAENVMCFALDQSQAMCLRLCRLAEADADCLNGLVCSPALGDPDLGACLPN